MVFSQKNWCERRRQESLMARALPHARENTPRTHQRRRRRVRHTEVEGARERPSDGASTGRTDGQGGTGVGGTGGGAAAHSAATAGRRRGEAAQWTSGEVRGHRRTARWGGGDQLGASAWCHGRRPLVFFPPRASPTGQGARLPLAGESSTGRPSSGSARHMRVRYEGRHGDGALGRTSPVVCKTHSRRPACSTLLELLPWESGLGGGHRTIERRREGSGGGISYVRRGGRGSGTITMFEYESVQRECACS